MTDNREQDIEVSFGDVAAETPDESVAHEAESLDDPAAGAEGQESANDTPPEQPTISSIMGGGPVSDGDELAP